MIALGYFVSVFVYPELILHILIYTSVSPRIVYPILFAAACGGVVWLICSLMPDKAARISGILIISFITLYFEIQLIYHCIFGSFMPLYQIGVGAGALTSFFSQTLHAIISNIGKVILILIPIPLSLILFLKKTIRPVRITLIQIPSALLICTLLVLIPTGVLHLNADGHNSVYQLLHDPVMSTEASVKNAGLTLTTLQELTSMLFGKDTESEFLETTLDDLDNKGKETNATVNFNNIDDSVSRYLSTVSPTAKNKFTGIAQGYNLITICAEAFSPYIISEELTPTLYKLSTNGIVFKNFYNSFPNTTTNGEYCFNTGLMPDMSRDKLDNSFNISADNYMPLCLGNIYTDMGYKAYGYHNYYGTFYDRHITHKNMGYDFKAILSGLDMPVGNPSSDLDMIKASVSDYIDSPLPFHVYYMTYSGHYQYNWDNEMSAKNRDKVESLPYSDEVKAYIACNLELEYALTELMQDLERAGKADSTVIVLTADHYPYGLSGNQYSELAGKPIDPELEKYRNAFICYIPGIEAVEIDNYCSTPDILPTVLNIMGIEFDSRLLAGKDVLSNAPHIAVLSDGSFITKDFGYVASEGKVISDKPVDDATLTDHINYVNNIFTLSTAILETDYYATVYDRETDEDKPVIVNYEDIDNNNVFIESVITFMVSEGYMEPKSETVFGINDPATVKEFIEVLFRMKQPEGYSDALEWAETEGFANGDIETSATYADIATVIYRYCSNGTDTDISGLMSEYPDIPEDQLAALKFCYDNKIILGDNYSTSFELADMTVTRYQIAAFLQRIYMYNLL